MRIERANTSIDKGWYAGDIILVEPGEAYTLLESSPDYFHSVIHTPGLVGEKALADKIIVSRLQSG